MLMTQRLPCVLGNPEQERRLTGKYNVLSALRKARRGCGPLSVQWALSSKAVILCSIDMMEHLEGMELFTQVEYH